MPRTEFRALNVRLLLYVQIFALLECCARNNKSFAQVSAKLFCLWDFQAVNGTMAAPSNSDVWMGTAASDISMLTNLEEGTSWKASTSSQNTTNNMIVKDSVATSNFSKSLLEEEWYTPEASLMELSSYSSSPYNMADTRSGFGLLESSLNFDTANNLITSFRSAPSTMCMENLGQGSSDGLFSGISQGGQLSRSVQVDSFSTGLSTTSFNHQGIISSPNENQDNLNSSMRTTFPPYSPYPAATTLRQNDKKLDVSENIRDEVMPYHTNKSYPQGQQQTLFQKRAASRRTGALSPASKSPPRVAIKSASNDSASMDTPGKGGSPHLHDDPQDIGLDADDYDVKDDDDLDESGDGSGGPEEDAGNGAAELGNHGKGNRAGKPRGLPAKNLMAERRRRKKLNDRLYMLRSVVPKITKMDRASILGDAIEYLKELLQRINDIHKELEAAKLEQSRSMPSSPIGGRGIHNGYPPAVKEECPVLPNPENQPPRVEVRQRDQALNIHMFCARRPGLLLSTVRALDALGLDVQQAVISCFNGFALDLFRAEAKDSDIGPDEIKAVLLLTAGCGVHSLQ